MIRADLPFGPIEGQPGSKCPPWWPWTLLGIASAFLVVVLVLTW